MASPDLHAPGVKGEIGHRTTQELEGLSQLLLPSGLTVEEQIATPAGPEQLAANGADRLAGPRQ